MSCLGVQGWQYMLVYQWNDLQWQKSGELEQEDAALPAM